MSQAREVRDKISSIKNTQKITRAMELVAASKMRKAQDRVALSRPYSEKIREVISHVAASHSEYNHIYLTERSEIKRVGYIVVSTDRGLCGGLNINLFRALLKEIKTWKGKKVEIDCAITGRKGGSFFRGIGENIVAQVDRLGDAPEVQDIIGIVKVMLDLFEEGKLDAIYVASNLFVNTMVQKPQIKQLLPLPVSDQVISAHWDYIYEPDSSKELLESLLIRYIESQVYQAIVENVACEQSARMVAMKSATDNAGDLIKDLQLVYNKARQASITQEISEIVAGAASVGE